eukprot:5524885-Amphidinium_carterae.1
MLLSTIKEQRQIGKASLFLYLDAAPKARACAPSQRGVAASTSRHGPLSHHLGEPCVKKRHGLLASTSTLNGVFRG